MLNYILPPIIIIISMSALIMFLFRKAQQLPTQELFVEGQDSLQGKKKSAFMLAMGQFGLKILERLVHKTKLLSLKFHNTSNDWFHSIREKRQLRARMNSEETASREVVSENDGNISQVEQSQTKKDPRPLIHETLVRPHQSKMMEKNKLEEALIRRIAINPKDIEAYERLGDYYLECESFQDSHECFKQVLKLSPAHYKAKTKLRRLERLIK